MGNRDKLGDDEFDVVSEHFMDPKYDHIHIEYDPKKKKKPPAKKPKDKKPSCQGK